MRDPYFFIFLFGLGIGFVCGVVFLAGLAYFTVQ